MEAAQEMVNPHTSVGYQANIILSTIPLVELFECVEALRRELIYLRQEGLDISATNCSTVLDALDAKLGKV